MFYELRIFTNIRILFILGLSLIFLALGAYSVFAQQGTSNIQYPVAELGNCASEQECHAYCDNLSHIQECVVFAEAHDLLTAEELAEAKRFAQLGIESGPGGCTSEAACEAYCEDVSHIAECLAFAEEHDVLEPEELAEARQVALALQTGAQLPGGCQNKAACEAYCEEPSHINECLDFAEAAGFIDPQELEEARRVAPFIARGEMPGGCRSKQECEAYCSNDTNIEECATFFEAAGFISAEEAEMFRKTGGRGPGGCQGQEECEAFCNDRANQEVCFEFGREHGLIPEDELHNIEEGLGRLQEGFDNAPPEVRACLDSAIGQGTIERILARELLPNQKIGEHMRRCFEEFGPKGPGGCQGEEECRAFCSDPANAGECGFGGPEGDFGPGHEGGFGAPPEAADCIQRIIGDLSGPPTAAQEQRIREECFPQQPLGEEFHPPEGVTPEEFQGEFDQQFQEEYQRQFEQQFQQQFDQQFQEEFQRQFEQQAPDGFTPPEGFVPPPGESTPPPPAPEDTHSEEPAPEAGLPGGNFLGAVWEAMKPALKRFIPSL